LLELVLVGRQFVHQFRVLVPGDGEHVVEDLVDRVADVLMVGVFVDFAVGAVGEHQVVAASRKPLKIGDELGHVETVATSPAGIVGIAEDVEVGDALGSGGLLDLRLAASPCLVIPATGNADDVGAISGQHGGKPQGFVVGVRADGEGAGSRRVTR